MSVSLTALHDFLANEHNLAQFKRLNKTLKAASYREGMHLFMMYHAMQDMLRSIASEGRTKRNKSGVAWVEEFMEGKWYGYTPNAVGAIADIQATLIMVFRNPALYVEMLNVCPALAQMEQIAPLGWMAYDELFNADNDRCFSDSMLELSPSVASLPARHRSRIHIQENVFDAVFMKNMGTYYYAERIPLSQPKQPKTFGEELRIVEQIGLEALRIFEKCEKRGEAFHKYPPEELYFKYTGQYKEVPLRKM